MTWTEATASAAVMAPLLVVIIAGLVNLAMWITRIVEDRRDKRRARG